MIYKLVYNRRNISSYDIMYLLIKIEIMEKRTCLKIIASLPLLAACSGKENTGPELGSPVTCTQTLTGIKERYDNSSEITGDEIIVRQLTLSCGRSTYTLSLSGHTIYPPSSEKAIEVWNKRALGDGKNMDTQFEWLTEPNFRDNCSSSVLRLLGVAIPEGFQLTSNGSQEILAILAGFDHPNAPNGHAPGLGVQIAFFNEKEFNEFPDLVMNEVSPGDIVFYSTADNDGHPDYHVAIAVEHHRTRKMVLYQQISSAGPSGYGGPEAYKYYLETRGGYINGVYIIRPNSVIIPLSESTYDESPITYCYDDNSAEFKIS